MEKPTHAQLQDTWTVFLWGLEWDRWEGHGSRAQGVNPLGNDEGPKAGLSGIRHPLLSAASSALFSHILKYTSCSGVNEILPSEKLQLHRPSKSSSERQSRQSSQSISFFSQATHSRTERGEGQSPGKWDGMARFIPGTRFWHLWETLNLENKWKTES